LIAAILVFAWLLGRASSYIMGGCVPLLLAVAIVVVPVRIIQGRRQEYVAVSLSY